MWVVGAPAMSGGGDTCDSVVEGVLVNSAGHLGLSDLCKCWECGRECNRL